MTSLGRHRMFSIAPMMDLTDRHFRYLMRLISPYPLLYTQMLTSAAVVHGKRKELLSYNPQEHPLALQLGGSDPGQLAEASAIGQQFGYDEINLNCGCPSDRVQAGKIGACLMREPELVAECYGAMLNAVEIPVTIKCRLGVDRNDRFGDLFEFIRVLYQAGCRVFIVHARKAWLQGLSPRENREIPPLRYDYVYRIKQAFPDTEIVMNGGIKTLTEVMLHLGKVDGVMLGREAYYNPYAMVGITDHLFRKEITAEKNFRQIERRELVLKYLDYMQYQVSSGIAASRMVRHLIPLYQSVAGARLWRRSLSEGMQKRQPLKSLVFNALSYVESAEAIKASA